MNTKAITLACDAFIKASLWSHGTVMNIESAMEAAITAYNKNDVSSEFSWKTTGAIVVSEHAHIDIVLRVMRDMDEEEFKGYYPEGLVTLSEDSWRIRTTYIGRFDIDLVELYKRCKKAGVLIRAVEERIATTPLNISGGEE